MADALYQSADQAWEIVLRTIRRFGAYYSVEFDDPAVSVVIAKMGGWICLCGRSSRNLRSVAAAEFRTLYRSMDPPAEPVPLMGIIERDNPGGRGNVLRVSVGETVEV